MGKKVIQRIQKASFLLMLFRDLAKESCVSQTIFS